MMRNVSGYDAWSSQEFFFIIFMAFDENRLWNMLVQCIYSRGS